MTGLGRTVTAEKQLGHGRLGAGPAWGRPLAAASPAAVSSALLGRPRVLHAAPTRPVTQDLLQPRDATPGPRAARACHTRV